MKFPKNMLAQLDAMAYARSRPENDLWTATKPAVTFDATQRAHAGALNPLAVFQRTLIGRGVGPDRRRDDIPVLHALNTAAEGDRR